MKLGSIDISCEYVVFGASKFGKAVIRALKLFNVKVRCLCDNDFQKWGTIVNSVAVISPKDLEAMEKDIPIIIASFYFETILRQLESLKFTNLVYFPYEAFLGGKNAAIWKSIPELVDIQIRSDEYRNEVNSNIIDGIFIKNIVPVKKGEKIRIVFLFQTIQHWPSWESVWEECITDDRIDAKIIIFEYNKMHAYQKKTDVEKACVNTKSPHEFLNRKGIEFVDLDDFDLDAFRPHVMLLQHPHSICRPRFLSNNALRVKGIRLAYIPYGIELPLDAPEFKEIELNTPLINSSWRAYTLSPEMKNEYVRYTDSFGSMVRVTGHPKFDGLFHSERFPLPKTTQERIKNRKLGFWNIHFPSTRDLLEEAKTVITAFSFEEYEQFVLKIKDYEDKVVFIVTTHPAFYARYESLGMGDKARGFRELLQSIENIVYMHGDDYRPGMLNADFIMTDHSALSAEAGATMKPVLFLDYPNRITRIGNPMGDMIDKYYHGSTVDDVSNFIEMCLRDEDPLKETRIAAFRKAVPYFDGLCGRRIKEDMVNSLYKEINY